MDKKEYIANQLKKTYGKKYENYCITRLLTKLDNLDLKFITQQMFKRTGNDIALADLYFPQVNVWVEIDESHHLSQTEEDKRRTEEVIKNNIRTKLKNLEEVVYVELEEPERIKIFDNDEYISIEDINKRIDEIVDLINSRIIKLGDKFIPWKTVYNEPEYFIKKGIIDEKDGVKFRTLQEVSELFNKGYKGNQRAFFFVDKDANIYVWCPKLKLNENDFKNNKYENEISEDGMYIFESSKTDNEKFVEDIINSLETRYVFAKYKDESGDMMYKFKGIYELDNEQTQHVRKRAWKKVGSKVDISGYFK